MLVRIVDVLVGRRRGCPRCARWPTAARGMPEPVLERALRAVSRHRFSNAYGLTETSSTIAASGPDEHRAVLAPRSGSAGAGWRRLGARCPASSSQVRVATGRWCPPGETGRAVGARAPRWPATRRARRGPDADGWFPTRDRARAGRRRLPLRRRPRDDTIIRGGENIAPAEIETCCTHPAVATWPSSGCPMRSGASGSSRPSSRTRTPRPDTDEIRAFVRARLRGSRTPDDVILRDSLPYSPTGKLLRRELVAALSSPAAIPAIERM